MFLWWSGGGEGEGGEIVKTREERIPHVDDANVLFPGGKEERK